MAFPYLEAVIVRQLRANKLTTLPKTLEGVISEDTFQKNRSYSLDHSHFHFVRDFVIIVRDSAILYFGVMPWFWKKSEDFVTLIGLNADNEILHSIAFIFGCMILLRITKLPLTLYLVFVLEARHDCNKFTPVYAAGFLFGNMIVPLLVGPPIVAAIIFLVPKGAPYLAIYVWALGHVLFICEDLIAPLFKKITPLPEGQLREKIEELAASLKFPARKLLVADGSKWSNKHSNVQMTGLVHKTGILLNDKIVQQMENLMEFNADPWYYAYRETHPPVVLRLTAIDEVDKKAD